MNILFLTENFPPETNAAATRVYERACYWVRGGHQVTVLTSQPNFPQGRLFEGYKNRWRQTEDMDGITVVRVKTFIAPNRGVLLRTLDFLSFMASAVWAGLWLPKPDVVSATSPQFFAAVAGWWLGAWRGVPFVFELGDMWPASIAAVGAMRPNIFLRILEKLELHLYRRAEAVVALTGAFRDNLVSRGIAPEKIAVIRNGVDTWRYGYKEKDFGLARPWGLADKFVVGYVGTHGMAHALGNVLDAAERLQGKENIRFLLVGAGAEREALMAEAERRGLNNVVFMEPQPKDAMPRVWSLCDVALVHLKDNPVFAGVIPSKIFEAMASGLPVLLAAPDGEASVLIEEDNVGLHVAPEDPEQLAAAVVALQSDPRSLKALAEKSLAAAPRHSREVQARHMINVLELAAAKRGHEASSVGNPGAAPETPS